MLFRVAVMIAFVAAFVAGILAVMHFAPPSGSLQLQAGTVLEKRRPVAEFELVDHRARPFTRDNLEGDWSLVFAGFTDCPDVCPATMTQLDSLDARLREAGAGVKVVFLSVDYERDTPERLAEYLAYFNSRFVGATGSRAEIDRFGESLGLAYVKIPGAGGRYTVDHSSALVLVDPSARVAGYFRPPLDIDSIAADLASLPRRN